MIGRGLKRKLIDYEDIMTDFSNAGDCNRNMPYTHQRQLVLNLCLNKLQNSKLLAEPNLRRSVLIANTLRQIQEETRHEANQLTGVIYNDTAASDLIYPGNDSPESSMHLSCGINANFTRDSTISEISADSFMEVTDDDMSFAISSILKDLDFVEDINPSPTSSQIMDEQPKPAAYGAKLNDKFDAKAAECVFGSFEMTSSTSYLNDLSIDDIFDDIDTSMYDSDFSFSSLISAKTQPAPEETLKLLSLCDVSNSNFQICRTDLNDLDHIMEILVGS
ncbi:SERTA domain-containing protein 2 [Bombina bombina]|uniref:SERTA domain-containing protein 2 n=1 Tax=Bombina bombina TaxID=8345 RepID=UPI00235B0296|nr:SERTA domain-containing protein 2 [Bombina bombina]